MKKMKLIFTLSSETEFDLESDHEIKMFNEAKETDFQEIKNDLIDHLESEGLSNVKLDKFEFIEVEGDVVE